MKIAFYSTRIGKIAIAEKDQKITNLFFENDKIPNDAKVEETKTIIEAFRQLDSYLNRTLKKFTVELAPEGTDFLQKVWAALCEIPYGKSMTYKEIAIKIGNPKACKAVGMANNRNPIPIFIPCHRVLGTNKKLTGYNAGIEVKRKLLDIEGIKYKL